MTKNTPIILDRLAAALGRHGVKLKRQQLLDVAAAAYGFRDAGVFSAKDGNGELDVPMADILGKDDNGMALLRDPKANAIFAMEITDPRTRASRWCVSPYGNILDISRAPVDGPLPQAEIEMHTATISHRHGTNFHISFTPDALQAEIAGFCDDWWSEAREYDEELPETTEGMTNDEIVDQYFSVVSDEYVERGTDKVRVPAAVARALSTPTGDAWVITTQNADVEEPQLWWNADDGWGDLASASVYADTSGSLPLLGMDAERVSWQRLPSTFARKTDRHANNTCNEAGEEWKRAPSTDKSAQIGALVCIDKIKAVDGVTFMLHNVERRDNAAYTSGYQTRTVLQTGGSYDRAAAETWAKEVGGVIQKAYGEIRVEDAFARITFLGDAHAAEATSPADWLNAMRDLVQPVGGRERIMADFTPEAWVNDHAMEVDVEFRKEIDVTYEMLLIGKDAAEEIDSSDCDHLLEAIRSPQRIKDWDGPFTISVSDAVRNSTLFD